ncbi:MAG: HAD hydrolase family protein [Gammaproteobacteria bacterium]|nr:HAD hydrolase family protein [Gammaproteobacteria bacterium]MCP5200650.1 HAD hydrolase family protein [Gammaproteobacteria bacterium]
MLARAAHTRLAAFDVDGVLTDGRIILGPAGDEYKAFDVRDGAGLVALRQRGVTLAIITGRRSAVVERRMRELGIERVFQGVDDKRACLAALLDELGLAAAAACYVGDDLPDIGALELAGLGVAVADACAEARAAADWVTLARGGRGAVREICDVIRTARAPAGGGGGAA